MSVQKPRLNARRPRLHHRSISPNLFLFILSLVPPRSNLNPPHGSFPLFSSSLFSNIFSMIGFFFLIGWIGLEKRREFFLVRWSSEVQWFSWHFGFIRFPMRKGQLTKNMCHVIYNCFKYIWFRFAFAVRIILLEFTFCKIDCDNMEVVSRCAQPWIVRVSFGILAEEAR